MATKRLVLITGAAGGIGRALVRRFIAGGDRVIAHDRDHAGVAKLAREHEHALVLPISSELPDATALMDALGPVTGQHGPVSAVVANAGATSGGSLQTLSAEGWKSDLDVNLTGGYVTVESVLHDLKATSGSIVFVGSVNGLTALGDPAYSAAKAGLISYARSLAIEYADLASGPTSSAPAPSTHPSGNAAWNEIHKSSRDCASGIRSVTSYNQKTSPKQSGSSPRTPPA